MVGSFDLTFVAPCTATVEYAGSPPAAKTPSQSANARVDVTVRCDRTATCVVSPQWADPAHFASTVTLERSRSTAASADSTATTRST